MGPTATLHHPHHPRETAPDDKEGVAFKTQPAKHRLRDLQNYPSKKGCRMANQTASGKGISVILLPDSANPRPDEKEERVKFEPTVGW